MTKNKEIQISKYIIEQLVPEHNLILSFDEICNLYFSSIVVVYNMDVNPDGDIDFQYKFIDKNTISLRLYEKKVIVDNKRKDLNENECLLKNAIKFDKTLKINDIWEKEVDFANEFSRSSINKIKSIFSQKCNILRNEQIYDKMSPLKGKIIVGTIDMIQNDFIKIQYENVYGFFPGSNQIKGEILQEGKSIELLVSDVVKNTTKTFPLIFTRNSVEFLTKIFSDEIPEIEDGIVEIVSAARIAGIRSKVVLKSNEPLVDPIGSCVGKKGDRINAISRRCANERIDLIKWSDDIYQYITNLFGTLHIYKILNLTDDRGYKLIVDDYDINIAIGRLGSNIRLVKEILQKEIEVITLSDAEKEGFEIHEEFESEENINNTFSIEEKKIDNINETDKTSSEIIEKNENKEKVVDKATNITKTKNIYIEKLLIESSKTTEPELSIEKKLESKEKNVSLHKKLKTFKKPKKKIIEKKKKDNILDKIEVSDDYDLSEESTDMSKNIYDNTDEDDNFQY